MLYFVDFPKNFSVLLTNLLSLSFELFHFYNVKRIIRIGTCGVVSPDVKIGELILADKAYSESTYAYAFNEYTKNIVEGSERLNKIIKETSR